MGIKRLKIIAILITMVCLSGGGCTSRGDFDSSLKVIVSPHHFSLFGWEASAVSNELGQLISNRHEEKESETSTAVEYFAITRQIKAHVLAIEALNEGSQPGDLVLLQSELARLEEQRTALESQVERIIEKQIRETLRQQGIFNPLDRWWPGLKIGFPPVNFELTKPPYLLVVSPREKIASMREILLQPALSLEEMEDIEATVDKLDVSSLVVKTGGVATYPAIVSNNSDLRFTIDAAAEEWLHHYLTFKPLGFHYLLDLIGISRNYEIATLNETVASMVSKEIGSIVLENYYPEYPGAVSEDRQEDANFDFNREMREIRKTVDSYLAEGEIALAEEFMELKRQYLASNGYYLRKLNQAYFAFHGAYADSPTSVDPIGLELKGLRSQSTSLKDFLDTAATMTSRQDLKQSIR